MTRKQRTALFSVCALLFLFTATVITFYSQGFRVDFENKKISQIGAFYFKVAPTGAEIYIDSQLKKRTYFLFDAAYIENLLPRKYKVEIKKEGYFTWQKNLEIKEKQVTEGKNITLFPNNPDFSVLSEEIGNFFFSPDEKNIILREIKGADWELNLYDLRKEEKAPLISSGDFGKRTVGFLDLIFSPDSKTALLKVSLPEIKYYLLNFSIDPVALMPLDFLGKDPNEADFPARDSQKFFFLTSAKKLKQADLNKKSISPLAIENVFAWADLNGSIYYLDQNGYLFKTDFSFGPKEKINEIPLSLKKEIKYEIRIFPDLLLVQEGKTLYSFNAEAKAFEKFSERNKGTEISPDSNKLVYFTDSEIWIFFIKKQDLQPQKLAGEKLFLTRFSGNIGNVFWINSHYLVFNSGSKIKISEIDERDRINVIDLAEFENPEIFFSQAEGKLFVWAGGTLYASKILAK